MGALAWSSKKSENTKFPRNLRGYFGVVVEPSSGGPRDHVNIAKSGSPAPVRVDPNSKKPGHSCPIQVELNSEKPGPPRHVHVDLNNEKSGPFGPLQVDLGTT